jgi:putative Holliday junction resolvase
MQPGRRIAFDYGDVRIGVAITDSSGILATPLDFLTNSPDQLRTDLINLYEIYVPIYTAVGYPLHLSGSESAKSVSVTKFAELITEISPAPIYLIDERMTTVSASRTLRDTGLNAKSAKGEIDSMAAVAILDSALNQERIQGEPMNRLEP